MKDSSNSSNQLSYTLGEDEDDSAVSLQNILVGITQSTNEVPRLHSLGSQNLQKTIQTAKFQGLTSRRSQLQEHIEDVLGAIDQFAASNHKSLKAQQRLHTDLHKLKVLLTQTRTSTEEEDLRSTKSLDLIQRDSIFESLETDEMEFSSPRHVITPKHLEIKQGYLQMYQDSSNASIFREIPRGRITSRYLFGISDMLFEENDIRVCQNLFISEKISEIPESFKLVQLGSEPFRFGILISIEEQEALFEFRGLFNLNYFFQNLVFFQGDTKESSQKILLFLLNMNLALFRAERVREDQNLYFLYGLKRVSAQFFVR